MDEARRISELEHKIRELTAFQEVGKALTSTLDLKRVLETILEQIHSLFQPDTWSLLLVDEKSDQLYFEIAVGQAAERLKTMRLKMGEGVAGWVALHGKPALIKDVAHDPRFTTRVDDVTKQRTKSIVAVPIPGSDGVLGVIELVNSPHASEWGEREMFMLRALADYVAIALQNARHVQRIQKMTITDDCTGLYNARHLHEAIETEIYRSQRYGYEFSLIFVDLDRFKLVNDTHGHLIGSRLLAEVGRLIKEHLRMIDTAFRYGGDEFVVLLPQTSKGAATNVVRRLHALVGEHVFLKEENLNLRLTASFGLASFPADANTKEDLIRLADEAMYTVKNHDRNNIAVAGIGLIGPRKQAG